MEKGMMNQVVEWKEAQKTVINVDLVAAAKQQLQFLATVDRNNWLYQVPALDRAIYRYNAFWLPLLAKHSEAPLFEGPLVVPLDCEWVWHCHRLNPARYKSDCEEFYGEILDNRNVVSSVQGIAKTDTEEVWKKLYPNEPYELDSASVLEDNAADKASQLEKCTTYDLISAVQRQSPFYYQVSRPYMNNDLYLEGAVARYKGFLHLIKRNKERGITSFAVPTYDIDLIWHTHQLHPASYCNDLVQIMGIVLEHDDTDSDRTKGKKLDVGFTGITQNWEETYGSRYWRAGAMNRGSAPSANGSDEDKKTLDIAEVKAMEVMLEIVSVKNLPEGHKGSLFVLFSKAQPDAIFNAKRRLTILSESGEKQVASFQCQPNGDVLFELMTCTPSNNPLTKAVQTLGSGSISLEDLLLPESGLIMEKWLEMMPSSDFKSSKPISLRVAMSVTLPTLAPYVPHMVRSRPISGPGGCGSMVKSGGCGSMVVSGGCGSMVKSGGCGGCGSMVKSGACGSMVKSGGCGSMVKSGGCGSMVKSGACGSTVKSGGCGSMVKSGGCGSMVKSGACGSTVRSGGCGSMVKSGGCGSMVKSCGSMMKSGGGGCGSMVKSGGCGSMVESGGCGSMVKSGGCGSMVESGGCGSMIKSGGCGSMVAGGGCGSMVKGGGCGSMVKGGESGGCGSMVAGGGCGSMVKGGESGGCGSMVAGGGCGSMVKGGGCGSMVKGGESGGCGSMIKSGGCGSMVKGGESGGCGSMVAGGGCGSMVKGGGCGTMVKGGESGGCGSMVAGGGCGSMINGGESGGCGSMVNGGGCGSTVAGGGCGSMVKGGESGGCGSMVNGGESGGCGSMVKGGGCGTTIAGGGCGSMVKSGGRGSMVESGGCGSN